jgi:hypothetical protein
MSYDFNLLPRDPGQSWRQVMEANERRVLEEGDRALSPAARTRLEQIADRLQVHDPQLKRFTTERYIELTRNDDAGIQMSLFSGELAISVAYWHTGLDARAVMQIVWSYLAILEQETGWEIYDNQLGRSLDRGRDLDEVTGWYAELTARLHTMFPETLRRPDQSGWRCRAPESAGSQYRVGSLMLKRQHSANRSHAGKPFVDDGPGAVPAVPSRHNRPCPRCAARPVARRRWPGRCLASLDARHISTA